MYTGKVHDCKNFSDIYNKYNDTLFTSLSKLFLSKTEFIELIQKY